MPATTTRLALPYPSPSDPNNVPSDLQKLANALDSITADYASGTAATRPTAGINGRFYLATDTGTLSLDNGTAWTIINASLAALLQNKGDLFVASAAGNAARLAAGADGQALVARAAATNGVDYELQLGQPMNLSGTGSPTRFVGGTVSGPPATGTFAIGDFVVTQAGTLCICTAAGTPGTWVTVNPETETTFAPGAGWANYGGSQATLAYAQIGTRVFLRGFLSNIGGAIVAGTQYLMATLPAGIHPKAYEIFGSYCGSPDSPCRIQVDPNGGISVYQAAIGVNGYVSIAGINFSLQ